MLKEDLECLVRIHQLPVKGENAEFIVVGLGNGILVEQLVAQARDVPALVSLSLDISIVTIGDRGKHEDSGSVGAFIVVRPGVIRVGLGIKPFKVGPGPQDHSLEIPAHLVERGLGLTGGPDLVSTDAPTVQGNRRHGHQESKENNGDRHRHHQFGQGESAPGTLWEKGNGHGWERGGSG